LKFTENTSFIQTPLPLIVVMAFMIAMMCILLGLLAEMIMRTFHESQGKPIYNIRSTRNFEEDEPAHSGRGPRENGSANPIARNSRVGSGG